jgi:hypothetical protein
MQEHLRSYFGMVIREHLRLSWTLLEYRLEKSENLNNKINFNPFNQWQKKKNATLSNSVLK